jgi:hypothetical protein
MKCTDPNRSFVAQVGFVGSPVHGSKVFDFAEDIRAEMALAIMVPIVREWSVSARFLTE